MDTSPNPEEDAKNEALIDNTAQGIFNYLTDVKNKREVYNKRWIWELLQNALDSAPEGQKIDVKIEVTDKTLIFSHSGRRFKGVEVAHLIYHGSSKKGFDIGKFGTGFLVTHLISEQVLVSGIRDDNKRFTFKLDRSGASADEIKELMEKSWEEYKKSLMESENNQTYAAEYRYTIDDSSKKTSDEGVAILTKIAPFVLAFNKELGKIEIINQGSKRIFQLGEPETGDISIKVVNEELDDHELRHHDLRIAEEDGLDVALKLRDNNGEIQVDDISEVPKIFIGFPLFATQDLPYPAILNSRNFEPTEKRDGIFLGDEDTAQIRRNKELLQRASSLFNKLVTNLKKKRCENLYQLMKLTYPPAKDWLTAQDWYISQLKVLINGTLKMEIVKTEDNQFISPTEAIFPVVNDEETDSLEKFWSLIFQLSSNRSKLPAKLAMNDWKEILTDWKSLGIELSANEITFEKLAEDISTSSTLEGFQKKLTDGTRAFSVLNEFYQLLYTTKQERLLDSKNLVLNQNEVFTKKMGLLLDEGIDDQLKEISKKLGTDVKSKLCHLSVNETAGRELHPMTQAEILNEVLRLNKSVKLEDATYREANVELLNWLLDHKEPAELEGYPALSGDSHKTIKLSKSEKDKPLLPIQMWDESARKYADLFPEELIISSSYIGKEWNHESWEVLSRGGLAISNPLFEEKDTLSQDDLNLLLPSGQKLDEDKDHGIDTPMPVGKLAFIRTPPDKSIIDTVRKSKKGGGRLLNFLFDYVLEKDKHWDEPVEVQCKCGKPHKIYSSAWLAPLKDRAWVWVRKDKSEKPTAHFLAPLFAEDQQLIQSWKFENPKKLLKILGVGVLDLMVQVMSKDEQSELKTESAIGSLYSTYMGNPETLSNIAELAESDPQLFKTEIEKRLRDREKIRQNQEVGRLVENLLKSALEKEDLTVVRTGVGSDYSIENDLIEEGRESLFEIKREDKLIFYLEIKATHESYVKMTLTQVKVARDSPEDHVLVVVGLKGQPPNEESVRAGAKFVIDIGNRVKDKLSEVEILLNQQGRVVSSTGNIAVEFKGGDIRFVVSESVWKLGKSFGEFLTYLKQG